MPYSDLEPTYRSRHTKLSRLLQSAGLDALVLNPGPSLTYLTGLHFHLMERPVVAIFLPHGAPLLVLPGLEIAKTKTLPFLIQAFSYSDNPDTWSAAFRQAAGAADMDGCRVGIEPNRLRVLELRFLEAAAAQAEFVSAQDILSSLRLQKDQREISAMRKAVDIAQRALRATLPQIKARMTERELASELALQLLREGSDPEMPFPPMVASGPNSANPHAVPTDRQLSYGDLLILDWGAAYDGYVSDLTRTFTLGKVGPEMESIGQTVAEANAAGQAAALPGSPAGQVDRAARQVIEKAGYGEFFIHRTGHGIGMEVHEDPYIYAENALVLAAGMAFTIEPGVYLPGRGGIRIEDNVIITEDGVECLSDLPRPLLDLGE